MSLRVLVVDDDPQIRALVEGVLADDAEVVSVADGASALRELGERRFGCVVLDVMMPGMSGNDVLEILRADPALRHLPVVMLTALAGEASHLESFRGGADAYVTKPFDVDGLLAVVAEVTSIDEAERVRRRRAHLDTSELLARIETSFEGIL